MKVRLLDVSAVAAAAFLSWFATFAVDCYYHGTSTAASRATPHSMNHQPPYPGDTLDNIFWFLQISDIHLSYVNDMAVAKDFGSFCRDTLSVIDPSLVLVTGDLTHGKYPDERWSRQFEEEWVMYGKVLEECGVKERLPWLDIRGNHDNFDVTSRSDKSNRFRDYSMSWQHHGTFSYGYLFNTSFGSYNFVGLDACPNPGPRRPFNFFGILHDEDLDALQQLSSRGVPTFNHTLWFSHYPSATISTNHHRLRDIMSSSTVHICGHLHTLGHTMPHMYGRHPGGHLELELGDFKDNRMYRLLAFDHDLFSFADTSLHSWPLVLVTNPKDAHFLIPSREPLGRISHSSHVRVLAFSPSPILSLGVWVDGQPLPTPTQVKGGPLYVSPWQPHMYSQGLHTIRVLVKDAAGREASVAQQFSVDGTGSDLLKIPQFLLLTDLRSLMRMMFLFLWLTVLSSLLLAWCTHRPATFLYPLVQTKSIFIPLLVYVAYFGLGPWYVGEVLTGVYGTIGAHGIKVVGHHLPGSMTYLHGILQILLFQVPLIYYLNCVLSHDLNGRGRCYCGHTLLCSLICHVIMLMSFLLQCGFVLATSPYGTVAVLVSPGVSWSLPLSLVLIYRACRTPTSNR